MGRVKYIEAINKMLYDLDLTTLEAIYQAVNHIVERRHSNELLRGNHQKARDLKR